MSSLRIVTILAGAVALVSCGPMANNNTKNAAPAADASTAAPAADVAGAKPDEAAPAAASTETAAKPETPEQAPAGAAADKPA